MRRIVFFISMLFAVLTATAQPKNLGKDKFNPEEFKARMDNYVREKAQLSNEEAEKIFPIYHEMKKKQFEIMVQIRQLKFTGRGKKNIATTNQPTEADYSKALKQINELNIELAKLQQTYYEKMSKELPAEKVLNIMRAEDKFHREMMGKVGERGRMFRHKRDSEKANCGAECHEGKDCKDGTNSKKGPRFGKDKKGKHGKPGKGPRGQRSRKN